MSTTTTWPGGATNSSPTAYTVPAAGELNWSSLSNFLNAIAAGAQSTTLQKFAVRKATATPVTVSATTDCVIASNLSVAGPVTINLPAGANKQVFCILDDRGDAGTNNVTINRNGSDTIAGSTSVVLASNREFIILCFNSGDTDWKIVARGAGSGSPLTNGLTSAHIFVGNASNIAQDTAVTGDISITNAGITAIGSGVIVNSQVNASAAIDGSKIVSATGSVPGVVSTSAQTFAGVKTFNSAPVMVQGYLSTDLTTAGGGSGNVTISSGKTLVESNLVVSSGDTYTVTGQLVNFGTLTVIGTMDVTGNVILVY